MALQFAAPFPLFSPHQNQSHRRASSTELRFSRWNNANAEPFVRRQREQKEIEDDIRRHRRHQSARRIAEDFPPDATAADSTSSSATAATAGFRSRGTPSSPSSPSIPGRASKYSKPRLDPKNSSFSSHPAFRPIVRAFTPRKIPAEPDEQAGVEVGEKGITYMFKDAPFEFQYSYTETPKVKPLALREPLYLPFGPSTVPRPWTGRAPLPPSRRKLPEFDSFNLPPPGKKWVKPVQTPGPFLAGSGPKYHAASREEILGEPLTVEEIKELIKGCLKTRRQLNMGRDGLTHNMLDNIHAHWKRRRVCKIKCKGVCTVDMDNVRQQLEEKTGGKIIYSKGGIIFLFRGRNYNYRTRPRFPLMLWRPVTPVYPRLVQRVPEGLTLEEATELRKRGRELPPICKLGKNGVYCNLVSHVKEAFEACELVRINCKDMNRSDCRKIGAKLRDLVPCILLSFEYEHILVWRGKEWKCSFQPVEDNLNEAAESITADSTITPSSIESLLQDDQNILDLRISSDNEGSTEVPTGNMAVVESLGIGISENANHLEEIDQQLTVNSIGSRNTTDKVSGFSTLSHQSSSIVIYKEEPQFGADDISEESFADFPDQRGFVNEIDDLGREDQALTASHVGPTRLDKTDGTARQDDCTGCNNGLEMGGETPYPNTTRSSRHCLDGVMLLLNEAVENGTAIILDDAPLDANIVYERSVALSKTAPSGPIFRQRIRKVAVLKTEQKKDVKNEEQDMGIDVVSISEKKPDGRKKSQARRRDNQRDILPDIVPHGSLRVDELAKLLA